MNKGAFHGGAQYSAKYQRHYGESVFLQEITYNTEDYGYIDIKHTVSTGIGANDTEEKNDWTKNSVRYAGKLDP